MDPKFQCFVHWYLIITFLTYYLYIILYKHLEKLSKKMVAVPFSATIKKCLVICMSQYKALYQWYFNDICNICKPPMRNDARLYHDRCWLLRLSLIRLWMVLFVFGTYNLTFDFPESKPKCGLIWGFKCHLHLSGFSSLFTLNGFSLVAHNSVKKMNKVKRLNYLTYFVERLIQNFH